MNDPHDHMMPPPVTDEEWDEKIWDDWDEAGNPGWWLMPALCGGAFIWTIVAIIVSIRIL